jgi:hypothetical protein
MRHHERAVSTARARIAVASGVVFGALAAVLARYAQRKLE